VNLFERDAEAELETREAKSDKKGKKGSKKAAAQDLEEY
jgi:hypothetical protein